MKNQTMRFELLAAHRSVVRIDRAVFGAGAQDLRRRLPAHLLEGFVSYVATTRAAIAPLNHPQIPTT